MRPISQQELQQINDNEVFNSADHIYISDDPDRKKVELKNEVITNEEIKAILNIKTYENERDTVSEDSIIASESEEPKEFDPDEPE